MSTLPTIDIPYEIINDSNVALSDLNEWRSAAEDMIASGMVQPIKSESDFFKLVKTAAYHIAETAHASITLGYTDEQRKQLFKEDAAQFDLAIDNLALSSGIHPKVVETLIDEHADRYVSMRLQTIRDKRSR